MTPAAEKIFKARQSKDDPEANCLPTGVPRIAPYPWRIVQDKTHVWFLLKATSIASGRSSRMAASIKTILIRPGTVSRSATTRATRWWWIRSDTTTSSGSTSTGHPHTEQLHTIERYTRKDLGNLQIDTKIIDPGAYTEPFDISFKATLRPREELMEYICQENQQDAKHLVGFTGIN